MADYEYKGPGPAVGDDGELVHPGDVREFDAEPDCPPWEMVPGGIKSEADPADVPEPPPASTQAHLDKINAPAAPAAKPEGM